MTGNAPKTLSDPTARPLAGVRVLDLTRRLSGPYCTLLLADLGAEVVKVEPPGGDPMRRRGPFVGARSVPFAALNRGKLSVELDLKSAAGARTLESLIRGADVLVENFRPGVMERLGFDRKRLATLNPGLVRCSLTAFGADGAQAPLAADDAAVQALCGTMWATGAPGDPPTRVAYPIAALANAVLAAIATVAAVRKRGLGGGGAQLDVAMLDSLAAIMEYPLMYTALTGRAPPRQAAQHPTATPSQAFTAADGSLVIMAASNAEFVRLASALGRPELAQDPRFATNDERTRNRDALVAAIEERMREDRVETWFDHLSALGVACAPVRSVAEALEMPSIAERGLVRRSPPPEGEGCISAEPALNLLAPPFGPTLGGAVASLAEPGLGGEVPAWEPRGGTAAPPVARADRLLSGVKILDLTRYLSGPYCTTILADLGATVIKVEPPGGDPARVFRPRMDGEDGTIRSGYFASVNRGKRSIVLDLKTPEDRTVLEALITGADVLIDNFRPGVLDKLGFDAAALTRMNASLVHASISGFGADGSHSRRAAFDMTIQAIAGTMAATGWPGGPPTRAGASMGDIGAGLFTALSIIAALVEPPQARPRRLDIAMLDCQLALLHAFADAELAGEPLPQRSGARHPLAVPLGAFKTAEGWVHVSAANDRDFAVLCSVLGEERLAEDTRFAHADARRANAGALYARLTAAFEELDAREWTQRLQARGLLAAPVRTVEEALESPEFGRRSLIRDTDESRPFRLVAPAIRVFGEAPRPVPPAPALDEAKAVVGGIIGEEVRSDWSRLATG